MITGEEIKQARQLQGLSLRQLATKTGLHHTLIHRAEMEGVGSIHFSAVMAIVHGLGLDIPEPNADNRIEADILGAMRNRDFALALRIIATQVEGD